MADLPKAVAEMVDGLIDLEAALRGIGEHATADHLRDLRQHIDGLAESYAAMTSRPPPDQ